MADVPVVTGLPAGSAAARPVTPAAGTQLETHSPSTGSQSAQQPAPRGSAGSAQSAPAAQTAPPVRTGTPVTVSSASIDLTSLPSPTNLAARVVAAQPDGRLQLETALGRVTVNAGKLVVDAGASARLQIDGGTVRLQVSPPQNAAAATGGSNTAARPAAPGGSVATLQPGDVVQARLVQNPAPGQPAPTAQTAQAAKTPTTVTVRIVAVDLPASSGAPSQTTALPAASTASGQTASLTPLQATVSGRAALGQPVLDTASGRLVLNSGDLPDKARVHLEVLTSTKALPRPVPVIAPLADAIDDVMAALASIQPAMAAALDSTRIPRMGARLTAATLFLMSALQGGGVRGLLGQDAEAALQKGGRGDLLKRLSEALAQRGARLETDTVANTGEVWRTLYLPVASVQGWQPMRVAWREPDGGEGEDGDDDRSRFQIDFSFSKLGPIRLDGLAGTERLDLLLISRAALASDTRGELETLFTNTIEAIGLRGHLRFVEQPDLTAPEVRADQPHASVTA